VADDEGKIAYCPCGKIGSFYSSLLEQVYCSDSCYDKAFKGQVVVAQVVVEKEQPTLFEEGK
jgi:hypothetical protein